MNWQALKTAGKIEAVRAVWEPDISAAKIAAHFNGVTRNAIIGLYNRHRDKLADCPLQLPPKNKACLWHERRKAQGRTERAAKKKVVVRLFDSEPLPKPKAPPPEARNVPLLDLQARECRFATNDADKGEQHLFCGCSTEWNESYCSYHMEITWRPFRPRDYQKAA